MRNGFVLFGLLLAVVGVACESGTDTNEPSFERVGRVSLPIQGGSDSPVNTYAVGVCTGPSPTECTFRCSGTIVAPNLVLTVRHCLYPAPRVNVDCKADVFGTAPITIPEKIWVTTNASIGTTFPGWHQARDIKTTSARAVCGADIAGIILKDNVMPVEAAPAVPALVPSAGAPLFGEQVAAIGFGESGPTNNDYGTRRIRQNIPIVCLDGDPNRSCPSDLGKVFSTQEFVVEGGGCAGDSGSGAYDQAALDRKTAERPSGEPILVGILARGSASNDQCVKGVYTRLDSWSTWIAGAGKLAAKLGGYPEPSWTQVPNAETLSDPNPFAPRTLGASCVVESDCDSNLCASADKGFSFQCTQACENEKRCPENFACLSFAAGEERCFYTPKPADAGTTAPPTPIHGGGSCSFGNGSRALRTDGIWGLSTVGLLAVMFRFRRRKKQPQSLV